MDSHCQSSYLKALKCHQRICTACLHMRHTWVERRGARQDGGCFSAAALSAGKLSVWLLWLYLVSAMNYKWSCGVSRLTDDSGYTVGYSDWANSGIKQRKDIWDGFIPTLILRHGLMCSKCETVWGFFFLFNLTKGANGTLFIKSDS